MWDWIVAGIGAYIGFKILAPLVIFGLLFMGFGLVVMCIDVSERWRRYRCKHKRLRETMSCDLVCLDCGKNLGFIGSDENKERRKAVK